MTAALERYLGRRTLAVLVTAAAAASTSAGCLGSVERTYDDEPSVDSGVEVPDGDVPELDGATLQEDASAGEDGPAGDSSAPADSPRPQQVLTQDWEPAGAITGWSSTKGAGNDLDRWATLMGGADTGNWRIAAVHPAAISDVRLDSPVLTVGIADATLSFRHSVDTEVNPMATTTAYDAGVLEIKVDGAAFADITTAGTFTTGGYTHTVLATGDNPLKNRRAWGGNSGGYILTMVKLNASLMGKQVTFRWRSGTDSGGDRFGWSIDKITITY